MTQLHLFNQKPILEVLKPIRFTRGNTQKIRKNKKS